MRAAIKEPAARKAVAKVAMKKATTKVAKKATTKRAAPKRAVAPVKEVLVAKPRASRAKAGAKVEAPVVVVPTENMKLTFEDIHKNPGKYAGKAYRIVHTPPSTNQHLAYARKNGEFLVASVKPNGYAAGTMVLDGTDLSTNQRVQDYVNPATVIEQIEVPPDREQYLKMVQEVRSNEYRSSIGADPEVFVEDGDGNIIPAFEFLPAPQKGQIAPFWDGYQAEFGTTPMGCMSFHTDEIQRGLRQTLEAARLKFGPKVRLSTKSTVDIPVQRLLTDDRKYVNFGCTPSLNVYGETFPEVDAATVPFRSAGGHIHMTYQKSTKYGVADVIKELDRILGVISVSLFQRYDDPRRRMLYGRAGEYRTPKYGFEYRTLSNAWMIHPGVTHYVYMTARQVTGLANKFGKWDKWDCSEEEARKCINECDVELAHTILKRNLIPLKALLAAFPTPYSTKSSMYIDFWVKVIFDGVDRYLTKPTEHSVVWHLEEPGRYVKHSDGKAGDFSRMMIYVEEKKNNMLDW